MESQPLIEAAVKVTDPVRLFASNMESPTIILSSEQIVSEYAPIASGKMEIVTFTVESQPSKEALGKITEPVRLFASKIESPTIAEPLAHIVSEYVPIASA